MNMKKYKLIKKYPGSPRLGSIYSSVSHNARQYTPLNGKSLDIIMDISTYPEFWEEVVEKDYEILEICFSRNKEICKYETYGFGIYKDKHHFISCFLTKGNPYELYSVKRKSDGEIFTVGDRIRHNNNVTYPEGIITKLHIVSNVIFVETNYRKNGFDTNIYLVHKLLKKPIFQTEDGVDIFEGDTYHSIIMDYEWKYKGHWCNGSYTNPKSCKMFSTKEKAEEYILMNKPCLSLNDVTKHFKVVYCNDVFTVSKYELKKLVKSKL